MTGIERAVEIAGTQAALAKACGVQQSAVAKWLRRGHAPWWHHEAISAMTGVAVAVLEQDVLQKWRSRGAA